MQSLRRYPRNYDAARLAAEQSAVPSQQAPVPLPYDPSRKPQSQFSPPSVVPSRSIVRNTFDSRPVNAYDWYWEDRFEAASPSILGGYTVPNGYLLILRMLIISIYPANTADLINIETMDGFGNQILGSTANLFININDAGAQTWTQTDPINQNPVNLFDYNLADIQIETFVLIGANNNLNISINGVTTPAAAATRFITNVRYYGNMLLSSGRTLVGEVGNPDPLLIRTE